LKTNSAKAKGRLLQNKVVDDLLLAFSQLEPDDIRSTSSGVNGVDVQLSPAAKKLIPYSIECKNQEKTSIWAWLKQAAINAGSLEPALIFKRNRSKIYVVIELPEFIKLIKK